MWVPDCPILVVMFFIHIGAAPSSSSVSVESLSISSSSGEYAVNQTTWTGESRQAAEDHKLSPTKESTSNELSVTKKEVQFIKDSSGYKKPPSTAVLYTPDEVAEYIFITGKEQSVTSAIAGLFNEGMESPEEAIEFLEKVLKSLAALRKKYRDYLRSITTAASQL